MKRLELVMSHCRLHDSRQIRWAIHPVKEVFDPASELISGRRRDEASTIETSSWRSDYNDSIAKSTGVAQLAGRAGDERALQVTEHPYGE